MIRDRLMLALWLLAIIIWLAAGIVSVPAGPNPCDLLFYNMRAITHDQSLATRAMNTCRLWAPLPSEAAMVGPYGPRVFLPPPPPLSPPAPLPEGDALASAGNSQRGITRSEVEAAIMDWCNTHAEAPLCQKLKVR